MTKMYDKDFKNCRKCQTCDNYVNGNVKGRDNFHITRKFRGSVHRDCNIEAKSNHKNPVIFHNLKEI